MDVGKHQIQVHLSFTHYIGGRDPKSHSPILKMGNFSNTIFSHGKLERACIFLNQKNRRVRFACRFPHHLRSYGLETAKQNCPLHWQMSTDRLQYVVFYGKPFPMRSLIQPFSSTGLPYMLFLHCAFHVSITLKFPSFCSVFQRHKSLVSPFELPFGGNSRKQL